MAIKVTRGFCGLISAQANGSAEMSQNRIKRSLKSSINPGGRPKSRSRPGGLERGGAAAASAIRC